jgi:hypothetical protein
MLQIIVPHAISMELRNDSSEAQQERIGIRSSMGFTAFSQSMPMTLRTSTVQPAPSMTTTGVFRTSEHIDEQDDGEPLKSEKIRLGEKTIIR